MHDLTLNCNLLAYHLAKLGLVLKSLNKMQDDQHQKLINGDPYKSQIAIQTGSV